MNFLLGYSLALPLILFSGVVWYVATKLPSEAIIGAILIMFLGDAILAGVWYYGIGEEVTNLSRFKLGCGAAFGTCTIVRAFYFLLKQKTFLK